MNSGGMFKKSAQEAGLLPASSAQKVTGTSFTEQIAIQKAAQASNTTQTQDLQNLQREHELQMRVAAEQAAKQEQAKQAQYPSLGVPVGPSKASMILPGSGGKAPSAPQYTQPAYTPSTPVAQQPTYSAPPVQYQMPESPPVFPTSPEYPTYQDSGIMPNVPTGTGPVGPNPFTFPMDDMPTLTPTSAQKAITKVDETPIKAAAKQSLWERFLAFFGLAKATKPSFTGEDFEQEIADIVCRSRAGDQNATAMICMITKNAERGNPKAIRSAKAIDRYIDKHPVPEPLFGFEGPIISCISHGPFTQCAAFGEEEAFIVGSEISRKAIIPNANIRHYLAQFGEEGKRDFAYGFWNAEKITPSDPNYHKPLVQQGKTIGIARRLQANRYGNQYGPQASWNIGE